VSDQGDDEQDDTQHVEDPDETKQRDHDFPPAVMPGEAA